MEKSSKVIEIEFESYGKTVPQLLDMIHAGKHLKKQKTVLLKPNLVNADPFPITTVPEFCKAVILYVKKHSDARVIIAEGCGDSVLETDQVFERLGYHHLADELNVELMDLNHADLVRLENKKNTIFKEMFLPQIAFESYVISLPVLKVHSLSKITGTLKNMMGFAPPEHYAGGGGWKKSFFHTRMHRSIMELNSYLLPDMTLMDASVGLCEFHLGGPPCNPPVNRFIAGYDAYEIDRIAAGYLGMDPDEIPHLWP